MKKVLQYFEGRLNLSSIVEEKKQYLYFFIY